MIREAMESDVPAIAALVRAFGESRAFREPFTADEGLVSNLCVDLIGSDDGTVFVAEQGTRVVGVLALCLVQHPLSREISASEIVWFVAPGHRGSGLLLLYAAEDWASARQAVRFSLIAPTPQTQRVYQRLGYQPMEPIYVRALPRK